MFIWLSPLFFLDSLIMGFIITIVVAAASLGIGSRLLRNPRSLGELRLWMFATALGVFAISVGLVGLVAYLLGVFEIPLVIAVGVALFMLLQWLFSPAIINAIYRVREAGPELEWLRREVERVATESGLREPPKLVVADMDAPNAFAYGSPLFGNYVAVTRGLLRLLPREEVVAVIAHEVGHLKHRDVAAILALALVPAIVYYLGRLLLYAGLFGGYERERESSPVVLAAIGAGLMAASFLLHLGVQHFSRLREYYADAHSALVTGNPRLLQRALARLHYAYTTRPRLREELASKATAAYLFIVNYFMDMFYEPWSHWRGYEAEIDVLVEELKRREVSLIEEIFSTHPPIPKRLRFLDELGRRLYGGSASAI